MCEPHRIDFSPKPEKVFSMTDQAIQIIITVEVEGRKIPRRSMEENMNAKIDESFRQEMQLL